MHSLLKCVLCIEMCTFLPSPGLFVAAENQIGIMIMLQAKQVVIIYIRDGDGNGDGDTFIVPKISTSPSIGSR